LDNIIVIYELFYLGYEMIILTGKVEDYLLGMENVIRGVINESMSYL
jgi:hypothetical protein